MHIMYGVICALVVILVGLVAYQIGYKHGWIDATLRADDILTNIDKKQQP